MNNSRRIPGSKMHACLGSRESFEGSRILLEQDGKPLRLEDIAHTLVICHSLGHPRSVRIC